MKTALTFGCWDLLHAGHVHFLLRARMRGDRLVVGVASDEVVRQDKGRLPVIGLENRAYLLKALRCVSLVEPYYELEFLTLLNRHRPDVLVVGEEWGIEPRHMDALAWMEQNVGWGHVVRLPRMAGISTSDIVRRIKE